MTEKNKELRSSPYGDYLGIEMLDYGDGKAKCRVVLQPHHQNTGGRIHGGVLSSLADTTAGVAVRSIRPEGTFTATTDLSVSFIRPPTGAELLASAAVIHRGRQLYRVEIDLHCADKLVAKSTATFMIVEAFKADPV